MFRCSSVRMTIPVFILLLFTAPMPVFAQTAFPFTGKLVISGVSVTGSYDFQFKLYTAASGGTQVGATLTRLGVAVSNGNYTVTLDFGADSFGSAPLYVQALDRKSGTTTYTNISGRLQVAQRFAILSANTQALQGTAVSSVSPLAGQVLKFDGTLWSPGPDASGSPYSAGAGLLLTGTVFSIPAGGVATGMLAEGSVTNAKLGDGSVTTTTLGDGAVTTAKLADASVTAAKLAPGVGFGGSAAGGDLTGSYPNPQLLTTLTSLPKVSGNLLNAVYGSAPYFLYSQLIATATSDYNGAWQSFTPSSSGVLTGVDIYFSVPIHDFTSLKILVINAGEGPAGDILAIQSLPQVSSGWAHFDLAQSVFLSTNSTYTWRMYGVGGGVKVGYAGGDPFPYGISDLGATYDYAFKLTARNSSVITAGSWLGVGTDSPARALQVGNIYIPGSEGMLRLASRSKTGATYLRAWDIGVPETGDELGDEGYSFVIRDRGAADSRTLDPQFMIHYGTGNVGIGTRGPEYTLDVNGTIRGNNVSPSDIRLKKNIQPLCNALGTVANLRGVTFDWIRDDGRERSFPDGRQVGFIAQEVEKVLPEVVSTDAKGFKSVAYQNVVPVLVEAVKQQQKLIAELKRGNAALEARLRRLEGRPGSKPSR